MDEYAPCFALVVEDEPFVRMHMVDVLEMAGWKVLEADCGERALTLLAASTHHLDLLVTDVRLGGAIDGWEVAEAYRAQMPRLGVVYASGNPPLAGRQVSDSEFLPKPIKVDALLAAAAKVCSPSRPDEDKTS